MRRLGHVLHGLVEDLAGVHPDGLGEHDEVGGGDGRFSLELLLEGDDGHAGARGNDLLREALPVVEARQYVTDCTTDRWLFRSHMDRLLVFSDKKSV